MKKGGFLQVIHSLPGRVRLQMPALHGRRDLAFQLEDSFRAVRGIQKVQASFRTGRVLINYAPDLIGVQQIQAQLVEALSFTREMAQNRRNGGKPRPKPQTYELEKLPLGAQFSLTATTALLLLLTPSSPQRPRQLAPQARHLLKGSTALTILSGIPIFRTAFDHLFQKKMSTELVAGVATLTSLFLDDDRFGLSALCLVYVNTFLRSLALESIRDRIRALLEGAKPTARLQTPRGTIIIPKDQLLAGSLLQVQAGERLAADGIVKRGRGSLDLFPIHGQLAPQEVGPGEEVYAGSILNRGLLSVQATRVGPQTKVGRLIQGLKERGEGPDQKAIRKLNQLSLLSLAIAGGYLYFTKNMPAALNMLVIGMPSAAGLAREIPAEVASIRAASFGALVKGGQAMEALGAAQFLLVEKGSFLAMHNGQGDNAISALRELNYKFPLPPIPNQQECSAQQSSKIMSLIRDWQKQGQVVGLIGAATGEAPLLAAVDVGLTKASGDDLHLQSASIILTGKNPYSLAILAGLARNSQDIAQQNSKISALASALGYTLGLRNQLTPLWTGLIQNVSNLIILFNSGRLLLPLSRQPQAGILKAQVRLER